MLIAHTNFSRSLVKVDLVSFRAQSYNFAMIKQLIQLLLKESIRLMIDNNNKYTLFKGRTKNCPPPPVSVATARNLGFTAHGTR